MFSCLFISFRIMFPVSYFDSGLKLGGRGQEGIISPAHEDVLQSPRESRTLGFLFWLYFPLQGNDKSN